MYPDFRVKRFVCPHKSYQISFTLIFYGMSIAGRNIDNFKPFPAHMILIYLIFTDLAKTYNTSPAYDKKFFVFGMMPMIAFGYTGLRNVYGKLTPVRDPYYFRKLTSIINVHFQWIRKIVFRQITEVRAVKFFLKTIRHIRNSESLT